MTKLFKPGPILTLTSSYFVAKYLFLFKEYALLDVIIKSNIMNANSKKILILITRKIPDTVERKLEENFSIIKNKNDKKYSYRDLKKKIVNVDIILVLVIL